MEEIAAKEEDEAEIYDENSSEVSFPLCNLLVNDKTLFLGKIVIFWWLVKDECMYVYGVDTLKEAM